MLTADVLALIRERTSAQPISLAELCAASNMSERTVKGAIQKLRMAGNRIDARRVGATTGYFLAPDGVPMELAKAYRRQMTTEARVLRAIEPPRRNREFANQLSLELGGQING